MNCRLLEFSMIKAKTTRPTRAVTAHENQSVEWKEAWRGETSTSNGFALLPTPVEVFCILAATIAA